MLAVLEVGYALQAICIFDSKNIWEFITITYQSTQSHIELDMCHTLVIELEIHQEGLYTPMYLKLVHKYGRGWELHLQGYQGGQW